MWKLEIFTFLVAEVLLPAVLANSCSRLHGVNKMQILLDSLERSPVRVLEQLTVE
jgi:hypothetical protein